MPARDRQPWNLRNPWIAAVLFVAGFISAGAQLPTVRMGRGFETLAIARNLARYGEFANPYSVLPTGLTAHCPPLYPALMAFFFWALGNAAGGLVIVLCSLAMHGLQAALMPSVSGLFFGDRRPGMWAAALAVTLPLYYLLPQFETVYFAAGAMLFCLESHRLSQSGGWWRGAATGILAGVLALLNPASVCLTAPWLAFLVWRRNIRVRSAFALAIVLGGILALAPWTWRNYRQFHALFFVRDNFGLELHVSNHEGVGPTLDSNMASGDFLRTHPNVSLAEATALRDMGEIRYNRDRAAAARKWMGARRGEFLALTAARARQFWFPWSAGEHKYDVSMAFVTALSGFGILLLALRREPALAYMAAVLLVYPALYYCIQVDPRFRAPILWVSLLQCGYVLTAAASRLSRPAESAA